jgi:hypothetical protein
VIALPSYSWHCSPQWLPPIQINNSDSREEAFLRKDLRTQHCFALHQSLQHRNVLGVLLQKLLQLLLDVLPLPACLPESAPPLQLLPDLELPPDPLAVLLSERAQQLHRGGRDSASQNLLQ